MVAQGDRIAYLYQARRVATQANAAGGAVIVDISVAAGQVARVVSVYAINSGTNSLYIDVIDEDNATDFRCAGISSAAGVWGNAPQAGSTGASSAQPGNSSGMLLGPGQKLSIFQLGAGIQNDTLTVAITLLCSTSTEPTWDKSRSTNQANVSLAASTISAANTMQAVVNL